MKLLSLLVMLVLIWRTELAETDFGEIILTEINQENFRVGYTCLPNKMLIHIHAKDGFVGQIYPEDSLNIKECGKRYEEHAEHVIYELPLDRCSTYSEKMEDDTVVYSNILVIQKHLLILNTEGMKFEVRCRYSVTTGDPVTPIKYKVDDVKTKETHDDISHGEGPITHGQPPFASMKVLKDHEDGKSTLARDVVGGDNVTIFINTVQSGIYGLFIYDCTINDGISGHYYRFLDNEGCALDPSFMSAFNYSVDATSAHLHFYAPQFPTTHFVYYKCAVKLCVQQFGRCERPACEDVNEEFRQIVRGRRSEIGDALAINDKKDKADEEGDTCMSRGLAVVLSLGAVMMAVGIGVLCSMLCVKCCQACKRRIQMLRSRKNENRH